jgi:DNA-binding transcriptional MerR regulator
VTWGLTPYRGTGRILDRVDDRVDELTIGQLARAAGVNVETVRYYERRGLLAEPPRSPSGYRLYSPADLWRLQFIARGKALGFTLTEIAEITGDGGDRCTGCIVEAAHQKIAAIEQQERALAATRARLEQLVDVCQDGAAADCVALRVSS